MKGEKRGSYQAEHLHINYLNACILFSVLSTLSFASMAAPTYRSSWTTSSFPKLAATINRVRSFTYLYRNTKGNVRLIWGTAEVHNYMKPDKINKHGHSFYKDSSSAREQYTAIYGALVVK